jgi:hypothetical protein
MNATPCPDANLCDGTETCWSGVCTPGTGTPLACNDGNPCTTDTCEPGTGCRTTPVENGAACSDNNACNGAETCQGGTCTAGAPPSCDDENRCTIDTCDAETGCRHTRVENGGACSDGNPCNGAETCQDGTCTPGPAPSCDDENPCTIDGCDVETGCTHTAVEDGTRCSDGDVCNGDETCVDGECGTGEGGPAVASGQVGPICDDENPCTVDTCDPKTGCVYTPREDGSSCDDGSRCNGAETCRDGECAPGAAPSCDDQNPCTVDTCLEEVYEAVPAAVAQGILLDGCAYTPVEDGTTCADADACNGAETCREGTCTPGTPVRCDDGDGCTEDRCVEGVCEHTRDPQCCAATTETCGDGADNDCDGAADCEDSECAGAVGCVAEICGNCIDDDANGLMDFEDPACCPSQRTFAMAVRKGRIRPKGETSRLRLRTVLAKAGLADVDPMQQDVFLQLRPEGGTNVFCAKVPAMKFMKKHKKFMFWDGKPRTESARGLTDMTIVVRRNGSVRLRTRGRRTQLSNVQAGRLQITVGFHRAGGDDAENRCSTVIQPFRFTRTGRLLAR